ncbi:MAG: Eco29kI family restriction endonuclease [Anaerolineae bacterium]|nr:Eco29kI family restriction endonuclease [Anaerolineae bacterium]
MRFDFRRHVFHSPQFHSVVDEAIEFFNNTPVHDLVSPDAFAGTGVYGLYYVGDHELYAEISRVNKRMCMQPIYVGKAVPPGWWAARSQETEAPVLYRRLQEHARSIQQTEDLLVDDFFCRFMILEGATSDLVVPVEAELIRRYVPLWNSVVDGFGNHDPGKGRYNQARSEWDILHSGRPWAERLTGESPRLEDVIAKVRQHLGNVGIS